MLLVCVWPFAAHAQPGSKDRHAVSARVLGIDYGVLNDADIAPTFGLEVAYRYLITPNLGVAIPLKIGVADVVDDIQNRNITSLDALIHFYPFSKPTKFNPYLLGGIGYVLENLDNGNSQMPIGVGVNYMMGRNSYLSLQGEYRTSSTDQRDNVHLGIGYLYQFGRRDADGDGITDAEDACPTEKGPVSTGGCPDTDRDGVADKADLCPSEKGPKATQGCPDQDGDGVADKDDMCPAEAGLPALKGCPDTDDDGVADKDDQCPDVAGTAAMSGCPDTDTDGVHDGIDKCPTEKGVAANNGCPSDRDGDGVSDTMDQCPDQAGAGTPSGCPDTDSDGIHDGIDKCPTEKGLAENKGCPAIEEEVKEVLDLAMRAVQFETGSANILTKSYPVLDQIADILTRYPAYSLRITGHTDNVGDAKKNQELSESRAAACYEYLLSKGAKASKMTFAGFGQDYPIAPNSSAAGRSLNRRVEFQLSVE